METPTREQQLTMVTIRVAMLQIMAGVGLLVASILADDNCYWEALIRD